MWLGMLYKWDSAALYNGGPWVCYDGGCYTVAGAVKKTCLTTTKVLGDPMGIAGWRCRFSCMELHAYHAHCCC